MKVSIELMSMDSDRGYVSSSGYQIAILVDAGVVVACAGDEDSLLDLVGDRVTADQLSDISRSKSRRGVCEYRYTTGVFDVPDGKVVVQHRHVSISTCDQDDNAAWVVNAASLKQLYLERSEHYRQLAENL